MAGWQPRRTVHPRVGGEHIKPHDGNIKMFGSSPRGRGTRFPGAGPYADVRFIPAWAGNTICDDELRKRTPVHPRVGGEHFCLNILQVRVHGSSPRGRGTPARLMPCLLYRRFIPAWAGNTSAAFGYWYRCSVHPRVGGEHCNWFHCDEEPDGSSPRGRGTLSSFPIRFNLTRFIPAWAGNTSA